MVVDDELLDKLADYYTSDFVTKNMSWIREIPFHEWLERQININVKER